MRRRLFQIAAALSVLLFAAVVLLWARSARTTDVCMLPVGDDRALLVTSHADRWFEVTLLERWPQPRFGWWSGPGWRNVGPFLFWQIHRTNTYGALGAAVWTREGQLVCPLASIDGPPAYEGSYDRAVELGYPGPVGGSADWARATGREIKIPYTPLLFVAALPCALLFAIAYAVQRTRQRRVRGGLCPACGYDLRATPGRCPECGTSSTPAPQAAA